MGDLENPNKLDNFIKRNRNTLLFLLCGILIIGYATATTILDETGVDTTGNLTANQNISATNIYVNGSFYEVGEKLIDKYFKATRISEYLNLTGDNYVRIGTDYWNTSVNVTLAKVVNFTTGTIMANRYYGLEFLDYEDFNNSYTELSKITFYNATVIRTEVGTPVGGLSNLSVYDDVSYNITETTGSPALDVRINFTGVTDFNEIIIRLKFSESQTHDVHLQVYDSSLTDWESYATYTELNDWNIDELGVYDAIDHIIDGVVQVRLYHEGVGSTQHTTYIDWIQLSLGPATFTTQEVDPLSYHKNESIQFLSTQINGSGNITTTGNVTGMFNTSSTWFAGSGKYLTDVATSFGPGIADYMNKSNFDYSDYWNLSENETSAKVVNFTADSIMSNYYYNFPIYTYNSSYAIDDNLDWTDLWNLSENETSAKVVNLTADSLMANYLYGDASKVTGVLTGFGPGITDYLNISTFDYTDFWNLSINVTSAKADNLTANSLMANYLYGDASKLTGITFDFGPGIADYLNKTVGETTLRLNITHDLNVSESIIAANVTFNRGFILDDFNVTGDMNITGQVNIHNNLTLNNTNITYVECIVFVSGGKVGNCL